MRYDYEINNDITRFLLVLDHYKKGVQKTYGTRYNTQARI